MPNSDRVHIEPALEALEAGRDTFARLSGLHGKKLVEEVYDLNPEQLRRVVFERVLAEQLGRQIPTD